MRLVLQRKVTFLANDEDGVVYPKAVNSIEVEEFWVMPSIQSRKEFVVPQVYAIV